MSNFAQGHAHLCLENLQRCVSEYTWVLETGCLRSRGKQTAHLEKHKGVLILFNIHSQASILDNFSKQQAEAL